MGPEGQGVSGHLCCVPLGLMCSSFPSLNIVLPQLSFSLKSFRAINRDMFCLSCHLLDSWRFLHSFKEHA